jgi:hypothetical protein
MNAYIRALLDPTDIRSREEKWAEYTSKRKRRYSRNSSKWQKANRAKGLCRCGNPAIPERKYCQRCKDALTSYQARIKIDVINAYGGECECCGEDNIWFLNIDHIHNDGHLEKKSERGALGLYRKLQRENYPKDRYRVLCYNCNLTREKNGGICPHKSKVSYAEKFCSKKGKTS